MEDMLINQIGIYIPEHKSSNYTKSEYFGYSNEFLDQKLGFTNLAVKREDETVSDMCVKAYNDLTKKVNVKLQEVELIVVVTQNPTQSIPHTSAIIHSYLGLSEKCMTFDISQGCAGYCHALDLINSYMKQNNLRTSLIFTCDPFSEIVDPNDKDVSMIFGDAATATLIGSNATEGYKIVDSSFGTVPQSYDCLKVRDGSLKMDGKRVFNYAAKEVPKSINFILSKNNLNKTDIDLYLLHQGSRFIVNSLRKILGLSETKTEFSADRYGNTVSSSLPILLSGYMQDRWKEQIVLSGFGVGFTWGTCLLKYSKEEKIND